MTEPRTNLVGRVPVLDSLRGAAALTVLWHHIVVIFPDALASLRTVAPPLYVTATWISDQNHRAVLAFFVLSGIAIRLAIEKDDLFQAGGVVRYTRRRAARILPLYWLALGWTAALASVHGHADQSLSLTTLSGNLLFLQTATSARGVWFAPFGLNGPLWSLSYEVFYYVLLPIVLTAIGAAGLKRTTTLDLLFYATCFVSVCAIALGAFAPSPFSNFLGLWAVWMNGFVIGDLLLRRRSILPLLAPAPAIMGISMLAHQLGAPSDSLDQLVEGLVIGASFSFAALLAPRLPKSVAEFGLTMFNRAFLRIGRGSYALYLLHYPLLLAIAAVPERTQSTTYFWPGAGGAVFVFAVFACPALERTLAAPAQRLFGLAPSNFLSTGARKANDRNVRSDAK